jgi:hypothetical protein
MPKALTPLEYATRTEIGRMLELTEIQAEILIHRLDEPSAIIDVFSDTDGLEHHATESLEAAIEAMLAGDWTACLEIGDALARELLIELFEGSTYTAGAESAYGGGEISRQKLQAICRSFDDLGDKIESVLSDHLGGRRLYRPG